MERHGGNSIHQTEKLKQAQLSGMDPDATEIESQNYDETEVRSQAAFKIHPLMLLLGVFAIGGLVAFGAVPRMIENNVLVRHKQDQISQAPAVSYVVAKAGDPIQEFVLPGATQAILDAPIYSRVDGYLRRRLVNIGDHVHKGQVLAEIETPELDKQVQAASSTADQSRANFDNASEALIKAEHDARTAQANVAKAKTDLDYAAREYQRYRLLAKQGAVSLEDCDTRLSAYNGAVATLQAMTSTALSAGSAIKSATAAVKSAKAGMNASQLQHDQYDATRSFKKVEAQFDGTVTQANVDQGALITAGSSSTASVLFEIDNTDVLRTFAYVPEQYVSAVHKGQEAVLTFPAFPGKQFIGTVYYVAGGLDPASRTLQVEIHLNNADHKLLPGMYAQVHFESPSTLALALIPGSAVQTGIAGSFVYIIDDKSRIQAKKVEIARDLGGEVEIGSGIKVGDKVVISPADDIIDGVVVRGVLLPETRNGDFSNSSKKTK